LELILKHSLTSDLSGLVTKFSRISAANTDNPATIHNVISDVMGKGRIYTKELAYSPGEEMGGIKLKVPHLIKNR
jgi:hypothetical protein